MNLNPTQRCAKNTKIVSLLTKYKLPFVNVFKLQQCIILIRLSEHNQHGHGI